VRAPLDARREPKATIRRGFRRFLSTSVLTLAA
jgi:hypothetical protein